MYYLTVLEARSPRSRCQQDGFLLRAERICSMPLLQRLMFCQQLLISLGWKHHSNLFLHVLLDCVGIQIFNKITSCFGPLCSIPAWGLLQRLSGKESACNEGDAGSIPGLGRFLGGAQSTLVFLPGKSHGQRNLMGYSPQGCKRVGHDWATEYAHNPCLKLDHPQPNNTVDG